MANDFPFVFECTDENICSCKANRDVELNEVEQITRQINSGELTDSVLIACSYHQIALQYYFIGDYLLSIKYNLLAKNIREGIDDGLLWKSYRNIGYNYYELKEYKYAISSLKMALNIEGNTSRSHIIQTLTYLSECYAEIGDYKAALDYAKSATQKYGHEMEMLEAQNALAQALIGTNDVINIHQSIEISKKIVQKSKLNEDNFNLQFAWNNLLKAYIAIQDFQTAWLYLDDIETQVNDNKVDVDQKPIVLNNMAAILYIQKKYKSAIQLLNSSLALKKNYYEKLNEYAYSANYENLADNHLALNQLDSALIYYQKALINLTNNFREENIFQNPDPKDKELFIYSNLDMIRVLHLKATAAFKYYELNKSEKHLKLANKTYQTAFDFHDQLKKNISTENSRLFQAKNIMPYLENSLNITYALQEKGHSTAEDAFRFIEKNKATVLLQSINESEALQFANLPDSLIMQEKDLKIAISHYKRQLNDAVYYEDTVESNRLEKNLFDANLSYQNLIDELEKNHLEYYRFKYQQNQIELSTVQNYLDDKSAVLEYFVGDSSIYILAIQKEQSKLYKIKKPGNWSSIIDAFRNAISLPGKKAKANPYTKKLFEQFSENAYTLFQLLLKEPAADLKNHVKHLKIIPDAELNYIPFDILLTQAADTSTVDYKTLPYLLKEKSIGYNYSAALMMEQKQATINEHDFFYGGYAAQYLKQDSINIDLPEIRQLVAKTAGFFNGKAYLNDAASKADFLKDTTSYNILHFAMHGILNDQYPLNSHLVFTQKGKKDDFKLYAADLYNLKLNTGLAVLSACDTGTGELQKGEGVMSLSRAFTYAGCNSLVMSLWSIPEKSTSEVLNIFFKNIKTGNEKDKALQKAKLEYLEKSSATVSHPVYWAGLVLSGNSKSMYFKSASNKLWWILVLLFVLSGGFFVYKKPHIN